MRVDIHLAFIGGFPILFEFGFSYEVKRSLEKSDNVQEEEAIIKKKRVLKVG